MPNQNFDKTQLPLAAMTDIPQPRADAQPIVALVKENGRINGYQLADGRILNKEEGVRLAKEGGIVGVGVSVRNGKEYLKALPDADDNNNLSNLPAVKQ